MPPIPCEPSTAGLYRCRSTPPGTPRIELTYTVPSGATRTLGSRPRTMNETPELAIGARVGSGNSWLSLNPFIARTAPWPTSRANAPTRHVRPVRPRARPKRNRAFLLTNSVLYSWFPPNFGHSMGSHLNDSELALDGSVDAGQTSRTDTCGRKSRKQLKVVSIE